MVLLKPAQFNPTNTDGVTYYLSSSMLGTKTRLGPYLEPHLVPIVFTIFILAIFFNISLPIIH
jgi:hypothetical protein